MSWTRWLVTAACVIPFAFAGGGSADAAKKKAPRIHKERAQKGHHPPKKTAHDKKKRGGRRGMAKRSRASTEEITSSRPALLSILPNAIRCPADMVAVAGRVCVDRFEISLVDVESGAPWPPFYPPDLVKAAQSFEFYRERKERAPMESLEAMLALPPLPTWILMPKAVSARDVLPQGYLNAEQAASACQAAGKRLCTEAEWVTACRGEDQRDFPYGATYEQGTCNVYRENHPTAMLHHDASRYHDDPRNNLVQFEGRSLLAKTGSSPKCGSRWGNDAIMDMVGNLDEWVDDATGVFVGGFYSRGTRAGCMSRIDAHPRRYSDYSTGARCCVDPR